MKVPAGSYLILARPRSRTAWLSALLFGDIPCYHDEIHRLEEWVEAGQPFGLSAPSLPSPFAPLDYAAYVYSESPVVVIDRHAQECYASLGRFIGMEFPPAHIVQYELRFQALLDRLPASRQLKIQYGSLEEYETVNRIHEHCLGSPLARERFHAFNLLRVEQHLPKVIDNTPAALFRRS